MEIRWPSSQTVGWPELTTPPGTFGLIVEVPNSMRDDLGIVISELSRPLPDEETMTIAEQWTARTRFLREHPDMVLWIQRSLMDWAKRARVERSSRRAT